MIKRTSLNSNGQILTSVIVFVAFGLSVIAMSAVLTIINIQNSANNAQSLQALVYAETGTEEAVINLIRNPSYAGGTFTMGSTSVVVTVSGGISDKTILSTANYNGFTKKIESHVNLSNNTVVITSWRQVL